MALFAPAATLPAATLPAEAVADQQTGILRWATAGYLSAPTDSPPSTPWEPRLMGDVELAQSAADTLGIGGRLGLGVAEVRLADADLALNDLARWGTADGRAATVRVIPVEDPGASDYGTPLAGRVLGLRLDPATGTSVLASTAPVVAFRGVVQRVERNADRTGTMRLSDVVERLAVPLQPQKYQGTSGLEGGDDLKGKPKPVCLGHAFNVEPVFLGDVDLGVGIGALPTFQVHWRAVEEIEAVRIRGVTQTLVGGTPVTGQARAFPAQGLFQLGSSPDGAVRADVRGDSVGGYVSSLPAVVRRMVTSLGANLGSGDLDATAFAFAEADLPGEIGWYCGAEDMTMAEACDALMSHCGAVLCGGRGGMLRLFDPLAVDAPQFTLPDAWILSCEPLAMPATLRPLPRAVAVGWRRNWAPDADIAGSVAAVDRERLRNEESGPARAESASITQRVAIQRDLKFRGLYWSQADALARAQKWRDFLQAGPRLFRVVTDRYLAQIECGHIGRIAYPAFGLGAGVKCTVVGWEERLAARRLTLTVVTQPETA